MKRAPGGGRKGLTGTAPSRMSEFKCPVCDYIGRSDNVIYHLKNSSEFDSNDTYGWPHLKDNKLKQKYTNWEGNKCLLTERW